mmetsp:Transcript_42035/g.117179  ORF Transcript_42035/g.117179 Transcript_42035/m.117179 type:complete len:205 (+) Transcript_42035:474-1088(+)
MPERLKSRLVSTASCFPRFMEVVKAATLSNEECENPIPSGTATVQMRATVCAACTFTPTAIISGRRITPDIVWPSNVDTDRVPHTSKHNMLQKRKYSKYGWFTITSDKVAPRPVSRTRKAITFVPPTIESRSQSSCRNSSLVMKPLPNTTTTTHKDKMAGWPISLSSTGGNAVISSTATRANAMKKTCAGVKGSYDCASTGKLS